MSITTYGPLGYEYQYAATALWLLENLASTGRLLVEPAQGEDAEATANKTPATVEIQAKSGSQPIDIYRFAEWLTHFPPHQAANSLLERLLNDEQRGVVFLAEGRSADATSHLTRPSDDRPKQSVTEASKWVTDLADKIRVVYKRGESSLSGRRHAYCNALADTLSAKNIGPALSRIHIEEQLDSGSVQNRALDSLRLSHHIPRSRTLEVFRELLDLVRRARNTSADLVPMFHVVLQKNRPIPHALDPLYIAPAATDDWFRRLESTRALLLTGLSQAGKTQTGRALLLRLRTAGFLTAEGDRVTDADRFLSVGDGEERAYLLDDPFGHVPSAGPGAVFPRLVRLIRGLSPEVRLIVTSRIEIVKALPTGTAGVDGNSWIDLTCRSHELARKVWSAHAREANLPPELTDRFKGGLRGLPAEELPQPGEMRHLARQPHSPATEFGVLLSVSRVRSEELASELLSRGGWAVDLLTSLSLLADTQLPASRDDIAYVLHDGPEEPGRMPDEILGTSGSEPAPTFPAYPPGLDLGRLERDELDFLGRHGYVGADENEITFSHPSYLLAAEKLLLQKLVREPRRILLRLTRALLCLRQAAAANAASKLGRIYVESDLPGRTTVASAGFVGLQSIFPEVRDLCVAFLLTVREDLEAEQENRLRQYLDHDPYASRTIYWHGDMAWNNPRQWDSMFESALTDLHAEPIAIADLDAKSGPIPPRDAWSAIRRARRQQQPVAARLARKLVATRAAFLRAEVARAFLQQASSYAEASDLWGSLIDDPSPSVAFGAIRGVAAAWASLDDQSRSEVWHLVAAALSRAEVAERCARLVFKYRGEDGTGEEGDIWARVASVILPSLPARGHYRAEHLWERGRQEAPTLAPERAFGLLSAWVTRLEVVVKDRWVDDYECGVGDIILLSRLGPAQRRELFERLLSVGDTTVSLTTFVTLLDGWVKLSDEERTLVLNVLSTRDADRRWFIAAASTRATMPNEIAAAILPKPDVLSDAARILEELPPHVLTDCLTIATGEPPEPRGVCGSGSAAEVWSTVLTLVRERPGHPQFLKAVRYFIWHARDDDDVDWWRKLCAEESPEVVVSIGWELLRFTCTFVGGRYRQYWGAILARAETRDALLAQLGKHIEAIEMQGNLFENLDHVLTDLSKELPVDIKVRGVLRKGERSIAAADPTGLKGVLWAAMQLVSGSEPPRLHQTYKEVLSFIDDHAPTEKQLKELVNAARLAYLNRAHKQEDEFADPMRVDLPGWVVGCRQTAGRKRGDQ